MILCTDCENLQQQKSPEKRYNLNQKSKTGNQEKNKLVIFLKKKSNALYWISMPYAIFLTPGS